MTKVFSPTSKAIAMATMYVALAWKKSYWFWAWSKLQDEEPTHRKHRNRQRQNPTNNSQMLNRSVFQGFLTPTWWREARIWSELASNKFLSPPPRFRCIKSLQGLRPKWPPSPYWDMLRWHALNPNLVSLVFYQMPTSPSSLYLKVWVNLSPLHWKLLRWRTPCASSNSTAASVAS